jgi:hypothetical protein
MGSYHVDELSRVELLASSWSVIARHPSKCGQGPWRFFSQLGGPFGKVIGGPLHVPTASGGDGRSFASVASTSTLEQNSATARLSNRWTVIRPCLRRPTYDTLPFLYRWFLHANHLAPLFVPYELNQFLLSLLSNIWKTLIRNAQHRVHWTF